ncbi:MAG: hypothetical protein RLO52_10530 [Sandaracinaceae bacterium]|nr:MAG: hypothetical protein EVA89_06185 [Sandaracinaceae bacterium]
MSQIESAHGKLTKVDQEWTGSRFIGLLVGTLTVALIVIFVIASVKSGDYSWYPFGHDLIKHTFETSSI